jgi:hypothetical protein
MPERPFELRVVCGRDRDYGLALYQRPWADRVGEDQNGLCRMVVQVRGAPLHAVMDQVLAAIKQAGYRPSDLCVSRRAPFCLEEALGVRLGLLFLAVKPLRKAARMSEISERVRAMTDEEAYYWFSKTTDNGIGRRCQKALRILLANE